MTPEITIMITAASAALVSEIARKRPHWTLVRLDNMPPKSLVGGKVWGFIDWLCPDVSGFELCRRLRESDATKNSHLTMILERPDLELQRRALLAGADDYLVAPLNPDQILKRVEFYAPDTAPQGRRLCFGGVVIDLVARSVRYEGRIIHLRPNEYDLLVHFVESPDRVFSRKDLLEALGRRSTEADYRTVDVWMSRLRRALVSNGAPDPFRTVRARGYVFDAIP